MKNWILSAVLGLFAGVALADAPEVVHVKTTNSGPIAV